MRHHLRKYSRILFLLLLFMGSAFSAFAQLGLRVDRQENESFREVFAQAKLFYKEGMYIDALNFAEQALQVSMSMNERKYEWNALELMGDIYSSSGQEANGIPYYLRAIGISEANKDTVQLLNIYAKTAAAYRAEEVYEKEQDYYENMLSLFNENKERERFETLSKIGTAAFHGAKYEKALGVFHSLLDHYQEYSEMWLSIHSDMISAFDAMGQYDSALHYCRILLPAYEKSDDRGQEVRIRNNMGYYYTLQKDYVAASESYGSAIKLGVDSEIPAVDIAFMKSNNAICKTNMGIEKEAIRLFNEAIETFEEENRPDEKSRNENMLAVLYHSLGDLFNAANFCREAISSAESAPDPWMKAQACLTYSNVFRDGNDPVRALEYYEKYLQIRDSIELARQMKIQNLENKKNILERQEKALQLRLKEDQVSELAIQQLRLQNEKMEQHSALLLQEKNLEILKQDSLRQSMVIKDQQFVVAQREKENIMLEQEKMLSDLKLAEEEQAREAAEREQKYSDQQLLLSQLETEKQKADKKALVGVVVGVGFLSLFILAILISVRRKNLLLAKQKELIEIKNKDLEQKNDEISAQRDEIEAQRNMVFDQKQAIEAYNDDIVKSIEYAKRLQTAALPVISLLQEKLREQFILFRPRDVVSGDFYWFAEVEGKMVITVADSTGHGVPGAFMSMMGMSLLKELVQKEYITHPGVILRRMRKEIINTMGQSGISGEQRDGMDMALVTFDPIERKLDYAGAYNSLYLVRDKKYPAPIIEEVELAPNQENGKLILYEIPADKMPIAHFDRMDKFRNHEINILPGDTVYMFTDGFADQFGGPRGKKFMYKPFKELLLKNAGHSLSKQHDILASTLENWMGDIAQVDDICVMGLRF